MRPKLSAQLVNGEEEFEQIKNYLINHTTTRGVYEADSARALTKALGDFISFRLS